MGDHAQNVRAGVLDSDLDGLTDPYEIGIGSNPTVADTDLDGLDDNFEVTIGTNPTMLDSDLDGLTDGMEITYGTNPLDMNGSMGQVFDYYSQRSEVHAAAHPRPDRSHAG